jgi:hypothetical protein
MSVLVASPALGTYVCICMDALSVHQCMVVSFTDVNGARMAIWPTARQQPGQRICQQILLKLTTSTWLAYWSVCAKPALVNKNAVVDQLQIMGKGACVHTRA